MRNEEKEITLFVLNKYLRINQEAYTKGKIGKIQRRELAKSLVHIRNAIDWVSAVNVEDDALNAIVFLTKMHQLADEETRGHIEIIMEKLGVRNENPNPGKPLETIKTLN